MKNRRQGTVVIYLVVAGALGTILFFYYLFPGVPPVSQQLIFQSEKELKSGLGELGLPAEVEKIAAFSSKASGYSVATAKNPFFTQAVIDPEKVQPGDHQKMLVRINDPFGLTGVTAKIATDRESFRVELRRIYGDEKDGYWLGEWIVRDTSERLYHSIFTARNIEGHENEIDISWSDPHACDGALGGAWTVSASCGTSGVAGADNGSITINSGVTLTIGAGTTLAFNSGFSITVNGAIAISTTGQVKQTNIWIRDADNDLYAPNATDQLAQDSQPTNYQRRNTRTGVNDCYDANANAKPGQTAFFTANRGDASFDYDCDAAITKQFTSTANCTL